MQKRKTFPKWMSCAVAASMTLGMCMTSASALNPFVQSWYTADPAPVVFSNDPDTLYVYTSHDEDESGNGIGGYTMKDYKCFSTKDMVNWTYHGTPAGHMSFSDWAQVDGSAWAQQVVERNGKYYMYAPVFSDPWAWCIGVGVSDTPYGPFEDALGEPLYKAGWAGIDPTVFIDDDGQAYMYWGNPTLFCAKLGEDMISIVPFTEEEVDPDWATLRDDGTLEMRMTVEAFGDGGDKTGDGVTDAAYQEGPWFFKRGETYYMVYPSIVAGGGESMAYSTSPGPIGPWTYRGVILDTTRGPDQGEVGFNSYTIHGGTVDFKGHSYLFYHNGMLPGGGTYHRSVAVEEFVWGEDGSIPYIPRTSEGVDPVDTLDPYARQEAETIAWSEGIRPIEREDGAISVQQISNGDSIRVMNVDFGDTGAATFTARVLASAAGSAIDVYLDGKDGSPITTLNVPDTNGAWQEITSGIMADCAGVHDVYFVFRGAADEQELFEFDQWQFGQKSDAETVEAINVTTDKYILDVREGFSKAQLTVTAVYGDGHSEDVTAAAEYTGDDYVTVSGGEVTGIAFGDAVVTVSFGGQKTTVALQVKDLTDAMKVASLAVEPASLDVFANTQTPVVVTATYQDGHTEDVSAKATYVSSAPDIAECAAGVVNAKSFGNAEITISYQGEMGEARQVVLAVSVGYRNPFDIVEAESFSEKYGNVYVEDGDHLGWIEEGNWVKYSGVDFGEGGTEQFQVRVAMQYGTPSIEMRLDDVESAPVATLRPASATGAWDAYEVMGTPLTGVTGVHDVYLYFPNRDINVDWWRVTPAGGSVVDPYERIEAETFDDFHGESLVVEDKNGYQNVGYISDGDWIKFSGVDFGEGANKVMMSLGYAWYGNNRSMQLRLDDPENPAAARVTATSNLGDNGGTGDFENYLTFEWDIDPEVFQGKHDLYIYFENGNINIDWLQFVPKAAEVEQFEVSFDSNGGSAVESQMVESGALAERPEDPERTGYTFAGWYEDAALETVYNFDKPVTQAITLYAKWIENTASSLQVSLSGAETVKQDQRVPYTFSFSGEKENLGNVTVIFNVKGDQEGLFTGGAFEAAEGFSKYVMDEEDQADGSRRVKVVLAYGMDELTALEEAALTDELTDMFTYVIRSSAEQEGNIEVTVEQAIFTYAGDNDLYYADVTGATASTSVSSKDPYDIDGDGDFDQADITAAQGYYRAAEGDANWDEARKADVNRDGVVDLTDLVELATAWLDTL